MMNEVQPAPTMPSRFQWEKDLLSRKLLDVQKTTTLRVYPQYHYTDKWIAIYGRLETKFPVDGMLPPNVHIAPGKGHPAGFGHLNSSPAQLVWPKDGVYSLKAKRKGQ